MKKLLLLLICGALLLSVAGCTVEGALTIPTIEPPKAQSTNKSVELKNFDSNDIYVCSEWLYDGTMMNVHLHPEAMMPLSIADGKLYGYMDGQTPTLLGDMKPLTLTETSFDDLIGEYSVHSSVPVDARALREQTVEAWEIKVSNAVAQHFMYVLRQTDGSVYIAEGRVFPETRRIYWLYRVTPAPGHTVVKTTVNPQTVLTEEFFKQEDGVEKSIHFGVVPQSCAQIRVGYSDYGVRIYNDYTLVVSEPTSLTSSVMQIYKRIPFEIKGNTIIAKDGAYTHYFTIQEDGLVYTTMTYLSSSLKGAANLLLTYRSSDTHPLSETETGTN